MKINILASVIILIVLIVASTILVLYDRALPEFIPPLLAPLITWIVGVLTYVEGNENNGTK